MRALVLAMALAAPLHLIAQAPPRAFSPVARAEEAGFSTTRLSRIDQLVNGLVNDGTIPGAVVFISRNGRVVMHKAYGYRDIDTKAPLQKDDIFRIASQSKAITSLAVSPINGRRSVSISNKTTPKLQMSVRSSTCLPRSCSGDI